MSCTLRKKKSKKILDINFLVKTPLNHKIVRIGEKPQKIKSF